MGKVYKLRDAKPGPRVVEALKKRYFDTWYCAEVADRVVSLIPKEHVVFWGGSMTLAALGIQERFVREGYTLIDRGIQPNAEERMEFMRRALWCDMFLCGSNAISENGQLGL
jgi:hypothetical protein